MYGRRLFHLFVALSFSSILLAQNKGSASLYGRVDNATGQPLMGMSVFLEGTQIGTVTDKKGGFAMSSIEPGNYTLVVQGIGFETEKRSIVLQGKERKSINFNMRESVTELSAVEVNAKSKETQMVQSIKAIEIVDIEAESIRSADVGQILAQTKGVAVQRTGGLGSNARFSLNGLTDDQIRYLYHDIPLNYSAFSFGLANIPTGMLKRVDVYKGVVPSSIGLDALGGAINAIPKEAKPGIQGSVSYQLGSFGTHRAEMSLLFYNDKKFFGNFGAYFDAADNDYAISIGIPNESGQIRETEVDRFHDGYRAYGATSEFGWKKKGKLELLSLELYLAHNFREIQNAQLSVVQVDGKNIISGAPFGEVTDQLDVAGANLRFKYNFSSKLAMRFNGGYNYRESEFFDVSNNFYSWFGEILGQRNGQGEVQPGAPAHQFLWTNSLFENLGLDYRFNGRHRISTQTFGNHVFQAGEDEFGSTFLPFGNESRLDNRISSIEYTHGADGDKLNFQLFGKHYFIKYESEERRTSTEGTVTESNDKSNLGYGTALRYDFKNGLIAKLSYEWATRLPRVEEVLGDGALVANNLELDPERSHNANLEVQYEKRIRNSWKLHLNPTFFWREIDDHIVFLQAPGRTSVYDNVFSARSLGVEFATKIVSPGDRFQLGGNFTFQDYVNTSTEGIYRDQRGDRIPNRPFLFANGNAGYTFPKIGNSSASLRFFGDARYVGDYFLSWESFGTRDSKQVIPEQFTVNSGLALETDIKTIRMTVTVEMFNMFDARVFDFFGIQRPGRSIFLKTVLNF